MRQALLGALPLTLALALLASASAPPTPRTPVVVQVVREADQLDYLFLANHRPMRLRLHARIADRPYDAAWVDFMDRLFAWFDKDKNGSLSSIESARLPNAQALQGYIQGSIGQGIVAVPFATLDINKDGKVSKEEFRAYFRNSGFAGMNFSTNNSQATQARRINEALLKRLDRNGDGKLSADELAGMFDKLRSLDENEDEMLTEAELTMNPGTNGLYGGTVAFPTGFQPAPVMEAGFVAVGPGQQSAAIGQIVTRYDRNKDGKLTQKEIGLDKALFDTLDRDKDGFLSHGELGAFLDGEPDIVFRLQLGDASPAQGKGLLSRLGLGSVVRAGPRVVVANEGTLPPALKKTMRFPSADMLAFELGDTRMSLQVNAGQAVQFNRVSGVRGFYLMTFDNLVGKKGYVDRSDAKGGGNTQFLFQIFTQADENADGKLTRKELVAWLDLVNTGQDCNVTLSVEDHGRGLFSILDADGDSRLSLREMKSAWSQLSPVAKDGKKLALAEIPRTVRVSISQGNNASFRNVPVPVRSRMPAARASYPGSAPAWFRKMDRNNDGDVSPKEWLGTEEDFKEIDRDGDGLISADEAVRFEKRKKTTASAAKP